MDQLKSTSAKISIAELIKVAPSVRTQAMNHLRGLNDIQPQTAQPQQQPRQAPENHEAGFLMDFEEELVNEYACQERLPGEETKERSHNAKHNRHLRKTKSQSARQGFCEDNPEEETPQEGQQPCSSGKTLTTEFDQSARMSVLKAQVVINKRRLSVVVDSGATHCMISDIMAKKLMLYPRLRSVNRRFKTANGASSKPLGILPNILVSLGSTTLPTDLYVCQASNYTMLLGNSFLAPAGIIIDYPKCQLVCHPEPGMVEYIPADYQNLGRERAPWVQMEEGQMPWESCEDSYDEAGSATSNTSSEEYSDSLTGEGNDQRSENGDLNFFEICHNTEQQTDSQLPSSSQTAEGHTLGAYIDSSDSAINVFYIVDDMYGLSVNRDLQVFPAIFQAIDEKF